MLCRVVPVQLRSPTSLKHIGTYDIHIKPPLGGISLTCYILQNNNNTYFNRYSLNIL